MNPFGKTESMVIHRWEKETNEETKEFANHPPNLINYSAKSDNLSLSDIFGGF